MGRNLDTWGATAISSLNDIAGWAAGLAQGTLTAGIYARPNSIYGVLVESLPVFIIHTDSCLYE